MVQGGVLQGWRNNAGYWLYPTKGDTAHAQQPAFRNGHEQRQLLQRRLHRSNELLTPVGAFAASPGPYGTYDQGGDVWQWNETAVNSSSRGVRGSSWNDGYYGDLAPFSRNFDRPSDEYYDIGFRVASLTVPEPGSIVLVVAGGLCLLAYAWRRRRRTA